MAKLTLDLVEGGTISLEPKEGMIEVRHIDTKGVEKTLGYVHRNDLPHIHSFFNNELMQTVVQAAPMPSPVSLEEDFSKTMKKIVPDIAREVKKIMEHDEDEDSI